ncbi:UvrD-helicase domain-containing protein [Papillibacter cinnamivorans]|uniref:DNA 3'-5' helicase n=1 Tax=Papillibacter cinnamivorans DSM 12816 TaxID=1122930 RepID=A0A1W2AMV5_9FIRM|nr:UvrD-helicase domain-containing protein [Papillibacter cinnamivorans]SMC62016.1 Superfamily I DNA or RNA helicase [Papillibacter cinnamivorans DSM 12816]
MAKMIDPKPTYHGEAKVWESLEAFLPSNVVVYNNREINGREFDYCLFMENVGVLIIEVKGWLSDKINVKGIDNIIVEGYEKPQRSPKKQARAYRFALLNKIVEKYNISPLVFDMVCYPFISKAEYLTSHLDIVSEEQFAIFKEDLESQEQLVKKIQSAYDSTKNIPHADFSCDFISKLRQDWEPDFIQHPQLMGIPTKPYSILSVFPNNLQSSEIDQIISDYFCGTKSIIFVANDSDYLTLTSAFNASYKAHNIQPSGNALRIGYRTGLKIERNSSRAFNLELYCVIGLSDIAPSTVKIEEGSYNIGDLEVVRKLSHVTTFNQQQYGVEHASPEHNILVEAGAGTGKTYSMVSRVAFLCNKKISAVANIADEIAMVTFTNDAAINMKVRLKQMFVNYFVLTSDPRYLKFVEDTDRAHISTIHSFAFDILRGESLYTGLGTNFRVSSNEYLRGKIYDFYLSNFLIEMETNNSNLINEIPVPIYDLKKKIIGIADRLLAKSIDLKQIKPSEMGVTVENTVPYFNEIIEKVIIPSETEYSEDTHVTNDMDLKECIILLGKVLNQIPGKLETLRLKYLFVDEFQDTDDAQIQLFQKLQQVINANCRMFVVGDLKQSIYRFRGARLSAFTQLMSKSLFDWDIHHLTINYRTDHRLLDLYDGIFSGMGTQNYLPYIAKNDQLSSSVRTDIGDDGLLLSIPCHAKDEDKFFDTFIDVICKQKAVLLDIMQRRQEKYQEPLSKEERTIAILVRSNWQVEKLVTAAKKNGIKIDIKSGGDLFQLESSQDLYKLTLALNNSANPVYMINFIESNYTNLSLDYQKYHGMSESECIKDLTRVLDEFFKVRMEKTWQQVINAAYTQPILFVLKQLYDALQPWKQFSNQPQEQIYYMANHEYLLERIIKYSRVDGLTLNQIVKYLKINILTGQQQLAREIEVDDNGIQLLCTTIHKSKGMEYGTVVLPYTDEDIGDIRKVKLDANYSGAKLAYTVLFENKIRERNSNYDETAEIGEQISEESRILYVALTRAIRTCVWIKNLDRNPSISWGSLLEE